MMAAYLCVLAASVVVFGVLLAAGEPIRPVLDYVVAYGIGALAGVHVGRAL